MSVIKVMGENPQGMTPKEKQNKKVRKFNIYWKKFLLLKGDEKRMSNNNPNNLKGFQSLKHYIFLKGITLH